MVRYESSCGHKIEEVTPKQIGGEHGRKRKEKKRKQTEGSGRGSSLQRTSSPGRDSGGEKTKEQKQNKPGQLHILCVGQERLPYTYINGARHPR